MNKEWIKVFCAGLFEVGWVIGLKHADSIVTWGVTLVAIFFSFYLMISASQNMPVGTVYAVFVGIGTTGTVLLESILFKVPLSFGKISLIILLLVGVIGLKLATPETLEEGGAR